MWQAIREIFELETAEKTARAYTAEQGQHTRLAAAAAQSRATLARSLTAPRDDATALFLFESAIALRLRAIAVAHGETLESATRSIDVLNIDDTDREAVKRVFASDDVTRQNWTRDEIATLRAALDRVERRTSKLVETRTIDAIRGTRFGRSAAVVLAIIYVAFRAGQAIFGAQDIALGASVSSSGFAITTAPPSTLVDGEDEGVVPVVTARAPGGWLQVDLGQDYVLDSVRLVNRHDREFDAALPFWIEVSSRTDQAWTEVRRQRDHFQELNVSLQRRVARYVRLRCESTCAIGLDELDIRGRLSR